MSATVSKQTSEISIFLDFFIMDNLEIFKTALFLISIIGFFKIFSYILRFRSWKKNIKSDLVELSLLFIALSISIYISIYIKSFVK
ncbi:hypothetical protein GGR09_000157 [Bartonella heixiaziensis]